MYFRSMEGYRKIPVHISGGIIWFMFFSLLCFILNTCIKFKNACTYNSYLRMRVKLEPCAGGGRSDCAYLIIIIYFAGIARRQRTTCCLHPFFVTPQPPPPLPAYRSAAPAHFVLLESRATEPAPGEGTGDTAQHRRSPLRRHCGAGGALPKD